MSGALERVKKEIAKLVRQLDPLPDVPARVEPLGPGALAIAHAPSWSDFAASLAPVRELAAGDQPREWMEGAPERECGRECGREGEGGREREAQRYSVQFTATQQYVDLLERARDLLSHTGDDQSLERVHVRRRALQLRR